MFVISWPSTGLAGEIKYIAWIALAGVLNALLDTGLAGEKKAQFCP